MAKSVALLELVANPRRAPFLVIDQTKEAITMRGHVYRRARSRWYAVIDLPATPAGKRRQQTTSHDTKREAQAWLAQRVQELRAGETYDSKVTVADYLNSWLAGR